MADPQVPGSSVNIGSEGLTQVTPSFGTGTYLQGPPGPEGAAGPDTPYVVTWNSGTSQWLHDGSPVTERPSTSTVPDGEVFWIGPHNPTSLGAATHDPWLNTSGVAGGV